MTFQTVSIYSIHNLDIFRGKLNFSHYSYGKKLITILLISGLNVNIYKKKVPGIFLL